MRRFLLLRMAAVALAMFGVGSAPASASAAAPRDWSLTPPSECLRSSTACVPAPLIFGLAVAPDGRSLYALSWTDGGRSLYGVAAWPIRANGAPDARTTIACVAHPTRGLRSQLCGVARGWPPTDSPFNQWGSIAISADGRNLYLTSAGDRTAGLASFARDTVTGALTQLPGALGCINTGLAGCARGRLLRSPWDIALAPDDRHVYVVSSTWLGDDAGGGIAAFARDPANGSLKQLPGHRSCMNETGRGGCRRDQRIGGGLGQLVVAPSGRELYTISSSRAEGPRSYRLLPDGSVGRSSAPAYWPHWFIGGDSPEGMGVDPDGRVYVTGHSDGLFVYRPDGPGRRLRRVMCWADQRPGCLTSGLVGYPSGSLIVAAPGRQALYIDGNGGVLTVHTPKPR